MLKNCSIEIDVWIFDIFDINCGAQDDFTNILKEIGL